MKRILVLGMIMSLFINCGGSDSEVVPPPSEDKVTAVNDSFQAEENTSVVLPDFLANDTYTAGSIKITFETTTTKNGKVVESNNKFTYTPASDFFGTDSFKYTICSTITTNSCSTAIVTIAVKEDTSNNGGGNNANFTIPSALQAYYNDIDFSLTGTSLKDALATKVINSHTNPVSSYTPGVWNVLKQSDLDPSDDSKVLLIYGYNDNDGNLVTDRTRDKNETGGTQNEDWNREHVYAKSLGTPKFENTDTPGSDPHHLRASDVKMNSNRENKKFAAGSGNAGDVSGNWYPGDEWKGDVARMMMYMYLRYGSQCLPKNVAVGTANSSDANMINLLLEWNKEDPVSEFEKNRNNVIANDQGNRNPIIDNPYLATLIWGGDTAENTWD
ncbi:endonuclease [Tenacibaculum sp. S7007]|uniref:Endonuclease n=1 Tax=Tenacibaculum pelagium TaxID=2759527 RepID=A0A839AQN0_9FLAO|nr:endonuclease [Tenacibaculum pelagium]MBA6156690.1 endonuclease [Tenacibaculum pelagium]